MNYIYSSGTGEKGSVFCRLYEILSLIQGVDSNYIYSSNPHPSVSSRTTLREREYVLVNYIYIYIYTWIVEPVLGLFSKKRSIRNDRGGICG